MLARQFLLRRARMPLARVVERVGCLQTQYAPSGYLGVWSRLEGFERPHLTSALERRTVVQATLMRQTIHVCSARDYWPLVEAIRMPRREAWVRATRRVATSDAYADAAARIRAALADGPRRRAELIGEIGIDGTTWNGAGLWVDLVRVPPSGTWERRSADLYGLAEDWLGPSDADESQGLELLVRRYLGAFGPGTRKDIASWAGVPAASLEPAVERIATRRFRDDAGAELVDLPRAPLPDADTAAPVRFLPTWDATLLVHARRTQILPEDLRPRIFNTKTPQSVTTFLVDGRVAGTWAFEGGRVRLAPFGPLPPRARRDLEAEAERLAAFMA